MIINKNQLIFEGNLTGDQWSIQVTTEPGESDYEAFFDLVDGGSIVNGPTKQAYFRIANLLSFPRGSIEFKTFSGKLGDGSDGSAILAFLSNEGIDPGIVNGVAIHSFNAGVYAYVNAWNIDKTSFEYAQGVDVGLSNDYADVIFTFGHDENGNFRKTVYIYNNDFNDYFLASDIICAPGENLFLPKTEDYKFYIGGAGFYNADPANVEFNLNSVRFNLKPKFLREAFEDDSSMEMNVETGQWANEFYVTSYLSTEPIVNEAGGHNFGVATTRASYTIDSLSYKMFYWPIVYDNSLKRNYRFTVPIKFDSNWQEIILRLSPVDALTPSVNTSAYFGYELSIIENGPNLEFTLIKRTGEFSSINLASGSTQALNYADWQYFQLEVIQNGASNTIRSRFTSNAVDYDPNNYTLLYDVNDNTPPVNYQDVAYTPMFDLNVAANFSQTLKTTGWRLDVF